MSKVQLQTSCPNCGEELLVSADVSNDQSAPNLRSGLQPDSVIHKYTFSSEVVKKYLIKKAQKAVPGVKMEIVPIYTELKKQKKFQPHKSYASFRIAFSEDAIANDVDDSWYMKIGSDSSNVKYENSKLGPFIKKFAYNPQSLNEWSKSYKTLEDLEDAFGITEQYLNDIKLYARPTRISDGDKTNKWIIFSAAAENIIRDMFTDPVTQCPAGDIKINDVRRISKEIVEFEVYLNPNQVTENYQNTAMVRSIMMGDTKPKKD